MQVLPFKALFCPTILDDLGMALLSGLVFSLMVRPVLAGLLQRFKFFPACRDVLIT